MGVLRFSGGGSRSIIEHGNRGYQIDRVKCFDSSANGKQFAYPTQAECHEDHSWIGVIGHPNATCLLDPKRYTSKTTLNKFPEQTPDIV